MNSAQLTIPMRYLTENIARITGKHYYKFKFNLRELEQKGKKRRSLERMSTRVIQF